jgi:hypothetical protein
MRVRQSGELAVFAAAIRRAAAGREGQKREAARDEEFRRAPRGRPG